MLKHLIHDLFADKSDITTMDYIHEVVLSSTTPKTGTRKYHA